MDKNSEITCRICIKTHLEYKSLFTTQLSDCKTVIVDFLNQITKLKINKNDNLPSTICTLCFQRLSDTFNFIQLCVKSDGVLKENLAKANFDDPETSDCDESFDQEDERSDVSFKRNGDKYTCDHCGISFNNKKLFNKHVKIHNDKNAYKCKECSQTFIKKVHLNVHLRSHVRSENKQFICKVCGQQFIYEYLLKQHEYKHSDEKPFPCTVCNRGCLTAESLKRHMKIHDKNYVKKKHSCKICMKEFDYPSFLSEHMKSHTGEKPHLCSFCGKGFRQSGALHYHQRVHTGYKPFTCNICSGKFMSQSVLKVHMRKHTNERPFVCHICGVAFRQSTDLKSHQRTHSGEKPVLCTICGKRMSTTGQLTIHIRSHTGEKPFICGSCSKAFTTKTLLIKHERIHTGERPYVCDICGRAFNQSSTLKTHKNIHDNNRKRKKSNKFRDKEAADENIIESFNETSTSCIYYKNNEVENIETEIVGEEFISDNIEDNVQDVEVKSQYGTVKTQFMVTLPAPIPFLHSL